MTHRLLLWAVLVLLTCERAVRRAWKWLRAGGPVVWRSEDIGYGFFPGGDPRDFTLGSDSTEEEVERHRLACEAWERGERVSRSDHQSCGNGVSITTCQYGIGLYTYTEEVRLGDVPAFLWGEMRMAWLEFQWEWEALQDLCRESSPSSSRRRS